MLTEQKRIFLPNLPENLSEDDVRKRFYKFGDIISVDIKHRKDLNARNYSHQYAFVTLETSQQLLQECIAEFAHKKWCGQFVEAQLAKESFLERLKREREGAQEEKSSNLTNGAVENNKTFATPPANAQMNGRWTVFSNLNDLTNEVLEDAATQLSTKFQKKGIITGNEINSDNEKMANTVIDMDYIVKNNKNKQITNKIEGVGLAPVHIETKLPRKKSKDPYREKADQKRLNSMKLMKQGYMQQRSLIKNALANVDSSNKSKIVFNDDNEDESASTHTGVNEVESQETDKLVLFDEGDESDNPGNESTFKLRKEYEGKKGKKLLELQARFNHDERFRMNAQFADDDSISDEAEKKEELDNEQEMQMEVLSNVLQKPLRQQQQKTSMTMTRFDPNAPEHAKYELVAGKKEKKVAKRKRDETCKEKEKMPEVSAEMFHQVSTKLPFREVDGEGNTPFSFREMFNVDREEKDDENSQVNEVNSETVTKRIRKNGVKQPFKYDSSSDDDNEDNGGTAKSAAGEGEAQESVSNDVVNRPLWIERFFFKPNDYRLQEGVDFVKRMHGADDDNDANEFSTQRRLLKRIVKRKAAKLQAKELAFRKKVAPTPRSKRHSRGKKTPKRGSR